MSRWNVALPAVALALVVTPGSAGAIRIEIITVANQCPSAPSWQMLAACFAAHGWKAKAQRDWPHGKLLDFGQVPAGERSSVQPAIVIYAKTRSGWQIGGYLSVADTTYHLIDAHPITINHTEGYRVEIGTREESAGWVQLQDRVLFCSGLSAECSVVKTACEVEQEGHLVAAFHGTIELSGDKLHLSGDRRLAVGACELNVTDERLTWP